jgi:hypothetical protein
MPKLSDYINAVSNRVYLSICIESVYYRQENWSGVLLIHFEDSHGFASITKPNDLGLPAIISGFDREDEVERHE